MINRRKRQARFIILTVVCVLLTIIAVAEGALYYQTGQKVSKLRKQVEDARAEKETQMESMDSLKEVIDILQEKLDKKEEELAAAREQVKELEAASAKAAEEGRVNPGDGDSLFSDSEGTYAVGAIVSEEEAVENLEQYFTAQTIERGDGIFQRINGKSYRDNENIALEQLRYLRVLHYNFDHQIQIGELIVNAQIQEDVLDLFEELFWNEYEIYSMRLVDDFWTDGMDGNAADFASIEVNNTSAFNYRPVSGGSNLSKHALGLAIDINPQQNPYVLNGSYSHENAAAYMDRTCGHPAVIVPGDICYNTFQNHGFSWGGNWNNPKDYQHFQID